MAASMDPTVAGGSSAPEGLQRLWAPWRSAYVADAAEPRPEGCPFCAIGERDPAGDREALVLHRGAHAYVVCNAYPYNPGHVMVIPYRHQAELEDLDDATSRELWDLARASVVAVKQRLGCEGVNLGANLGSASGAGIAPHLHLHVVPRWGGDTNFMSVIGATRVLPQALDEVHERLVGAWG